MNFETKLEKQLEEYLVASSRMGASDVDWLLARDIMTLLNRCFCSIPVLLHLAIRRRD
jgi:hypothetical protein